jgi:hypothetical protein
LVASLSFESAPAIQDQIPAFEKQRLETRAGERCIREGRHAILALATQIPGKR